MDHRAQTTGSNKVVGVPGSFNRLELPLASGEDPEINEQSQRAARRNDVIIISDDETPEVSTAPGPSADVSATAKGRSESVSSVDQPFASTRTTSNFESSPTRLIANQLQALNLPTTPTKSPLASTSERSDWGADACLVLDDRENTPQSPDPYARQDSTPLETPPKRKSKKAKAKTVNALNKMPDYESWSVAELQVGLLANACATLAHLELTLSRRSRME